MLSIYTNRSLKAIKNASANIDSISFKTARYISIKNVVITLQSKNKIKIKKII